MKRNYHLFKDKKRWLIPIMLSFVLAVMSAVPTYAQTPCSVVTANFTEDFETTPTGSSANITYPNCWTYINTIGSGYAYVNTTAANNGNRGYYTYRPSTATATGDLLLISPETANLGNGTKQIRFWAKKSSATYVPKFEIYTMNGKTATATKTLVQGAINLTTTWQEFIVALPATTDDYFAFSFDRVGTSASYVYVDDIHYENLSACMFPANIDVTNITGNSATVSWDPSIASGVTGYEYEIRSSGDPGSGAAGLEASGTTTNTTVNVTGLSPAGSYMVYVRSVCGTSSGIWTKFPVSFNTLCGIITGNLFEGFENTASGSSVNITYPNCWSYVNTIGSGYGYVNTTASNNGSNGFYTYRPSTATATGDLLLISPETANLGSGTKQLRFWAKVSSATATPQFEVYSMDGNTATANKTLVQGSIPLTTTWQEFIVPLPTTTDDYFAFSFDRVGNTAAYVYLDDVYYEDLAACMFPMNIDVTNITGNTATLSWNPSTAPGVTGYEYEVRSSGAPGSGAAGLEASGTATAATVNVTGLNPASSYTVYVRSVCGSSSGIWTTFPVSFNTLCGIITGNLFEGFENTPTGSSVNITYPNCWSYLNSASVGYGYVSTSAANNGSNGFYTYRPTAGDGDLLLISPETSNLGNGTKQIRFWAKVSSTSYMPKFEIYTMDGTTATANKTLVQGSIPLTTTWQEFIVPLPATTDDYFAFSFDRDNYISYVYIDDIYYEDISPCVFPMNIKTSNITTTGVTISWNASLASGVTGYEYEIRTSGAPGSGATGLVTSGTTTGATTANVTGLTGATTYYVYVRSICGTSKGIWSTFPAEFMTLCPIYTSNFYEGFATTPTGTSTNNTVPNCWTYLNTAGVGYGYSTSTAGRSNLGFYTYRPQAGDGDLLLISPETNDLGNGTKQIRFWAKVTSASYMPKFEIYSMDGTTATANKTLVQGSIPLTTTWQEFIVPLPATTDDYFAFSFDRDGAVSYVYLDDIYYEDLSPCIYPSNLAVTGITTGSATVSWDASLASGVTGYDYEIRTSGAAGSGATGLVSSGTTTSTSVNITGLNHSTQYTVYVRSKCGTANGMWTLFPVQFYTLCDIMTGNFYEGFDTTSTGSSTNATYPYCWTYIDDVVTTGYGYVSGTPKSTPNSYYMYRTNSAANNGQNLMLISPETDNLGNGNGVKQVRFSARSSSSSNSNILEIVTADSNGPGANITVLDTLTVNQTSYDEYTVIFPHTTDDYFGFRLAHNGTTTTSSVYIDDVYYEDAPDCKSVNPKTIKISTILKNSAEIQWADYFNVNASYEVEVRESGNPGTSGAAFVTTTAAGATKVIATGLNPSTRYYVYVRTKCNPTGTGEWIDGGSFNTLCNYPNLISAPALEVCGSGPVELTATYDNGTVYWYDAPVEGNLVHTGSNFTTPPIAVNTSYWVTAMDGAAPVSSYVGKVSANADAGTGGGLTTYMNFTAHADFVLETVDLFPSGSGAGTVEIELRTDTGTPIMSKVVNVTGGTATSAAQTVTLNFAIQGGADYRLGVKSWTGGVSNLYRDDNNFSYPYTDANNLVSITGPSLAGYYYFFYNWKVVGGSCQAPRMEVPITVQPKPVFELSTDKVTSCEGDASSVVTVATNQGGYDTFVWTPSTGVSGNAATGWTFSTANEQLYTLVASQSTGICEVEQTVLVFAGTQPEANPNLATSFDVCKDVVTKLDLLKTLPAQATIGAAKTTTAANLAMSAFVQSSVYSRQQFIYSAAELTAQGVTGAGYITSLSFETTDAGASLSNPSYTLKMMLSPNTSFGNTSFYTGNFSTVYTKVNHTHSFQGVQTFIFDNAFYWDGQSNIVLEILQEGEGGGNNAKTYYSGVTGTNVGLYAGSATDANPLTGTLTVNRLNTVFGFKQAAVTWSPTNNLYLDAAATVPYTSGVDAPTVYTVSSTGGSQVYTATLTGANGCATTKAYTVNTVDVGILSVQDQVFCKAVPVTDVVVTGAPAASLSFYSSATSTTPITTISQNGTYYVEAKLGNCKSARIPFNASIVALALPSAQLTQVICGSGTIADLSARGANGAQIKWYSSATSTTPLPSTHVLTDNTTYYASQSSNGCESGRIGVLVDINPIPPALTPQTISLCGALNYGSVNLNQVTGSELVWYQSATSQQPIPNTDAVVSGTYYVSQKINGCESPRVPVNAAAQGSVAAPSATIQNMCGGGTVAQLVAQTLPNATAEWFSSATSTVPLAGTTPLLNGTYYLAQRIGNCMSVKVPVAVRVINMTAPVVSPFTLCEGSTVADLVVPAGMGITHKWYTSATSTTELLSTDVLQSAYYFVEREQGGCISGRTQVQVTISSLPGSPTGDSPQSFDNYAELKDIIMDQPNVVWYLTYDDAVNGVNALPQNMPLVDGATYYAVIIGANGCPSDPTAIQVIVKLGLNDFDLSRLKYYPNPVSDMLTVHYSEVITKVEVFDLNGRLVMTRNFDKPEVQLDFSALSAGTYMLNIQTKDNSQFVKVVKK